MEHRHLGIVLLIVRGLDLDPGTGLGQYSSLAACQAVCGTPTPSWDCGAQGCYDPGTGLEHIHLYLLVKLLC